MAVVRYNDLTRFQLACYAATCAVSMLCFLCTTMVLFQPMAGCDQGAWTLWQKCILHNETAPITGLDDLDCHYFPTMPAFVHLGRIGLSLFLVIRALDSVCLFWTCRTGTHNTRLIKVCLEALTCGLAMLTSWYFTLLHDRDFLDGELDGELTGCQVYDTLWIVLWPYICVPCQYIVTVGWAAYFVFFLMGTPREEHYRGIVRDVEAAVVAVRVVTIDADSSSDGTCDDSSSEMDDSNSSGHTHDDRCLNCNLSIGQSCKDESWLSRSEASLIYEDMDPSIFDYTIYSETTH